MSDALSENREQALIAVFHAIKDLDIDVNELLEKAYQHLMKTQREPFANSVMSTIQIALGQVSGALSKDPPAQ